MSEQNMNTDEEQITVLLQWKTMKKSTAQF